MDIEEKNETNIKEIKKQTSKQTSKKYKVSNIMNPMKTGKYSKKLPQNAIKYLSNPEEFKKLLEKTIDALEKAELDDKTKIFYLNTLNNTFKTIYGNRNINLNVEVRPDSAKRMHEIYLDVHPNIIEPYASNKEDEHVNNRDESGTITD